MADLSPLRDMRDNKELEKLPECERKDWHKRWADVQQTLKDAEGRFTQTRIEGVLTAKEKTKFHEVTLTAGKTYVLDMESSAFDIFLKLQDAKGKLLAENDDITPGANLNSRIAFTPK